MASCISSAPATPLCLPSSEFVRARGEKPASLSWSSSLPIFNLSINLASYPSNPTRNQSFVVQAAWTRRSRSEAEKKPNRKSWKQKTDMYMRPFLLNVFFSKRFVHAKVMHRGTSKVISVATTNAKDLRNTLPSLTDTNACRVIGKLIAERSKEADVFAMSYEAKKNERIEGRLEKMFEKVELVVLPEEHPDSVRVKSIGDKIVKALESDLKAMKGKELTVRHLVDIKWEFLVVKDTNIMMAVPGGKICLSSDLLKHFESDAEIATIIGHEVGHIVARHVPGRMNMAVLATLANIHLGLAISIPNMTERIPHGLKELGRVLFTYPRRRRDEREADYIGLLLMASAGFDPQEAPKVYATYDQLFPSSKSYFYKPQPSGKERAIALVEVLEEANSIYSKTIESSWKEDS